jgi:glycosyltransferase involved in cell wall biosynthesis
MRLLWVIHLYPPKHNCGAEWMAHAVNKYLLSRGHEVRVILMQGKMHKINLPYVFDGVTVMRDPGENFDAYRWADVILTHLDFTKLAINVARMVKRPVVNFIHSHYTYDPNPIPSAKSDCHVVYNSQWVKEHLNYNWPSMVMFPPCDPDHYNVNDNPIRNNYISMISINENKGGWILYRVAKAMPYAKFIGVMGSYDDGGLQKEIRSRVEAECPNVEIVPNGPNILDVYRKTRILLMPSRYESWGRTATEAMCNGIPVICTKTKGLEENCGKAGLFIPDRGPCKANDYGHITEHDGDSYDIKSILDHIKDLDNDWYYEQVSQECRKRAAELDPKQSMQELEQFIINAKHYKGYKENARQITH